MKTLTASQLDSLSDTARTNARQRMNHNLHLTHDAPVQRLAIAMEPDTYVRPHRHTHSWELLLPLRGRFLFVSYDDDGKPQARHVLGGKDGLAALEFDAGTWHTVASLEAGSVIFEVKEGPYTPIGPADAATWSPMEGSLEAAAFVAALRASVV